FNWQRSVVVVEEMPLGVIEGVPEHRRKVKFGPGLRTVFKSGRLRKAIRPVKLVIHREGAVPEIVFRQQRPTGTVLTAAPEIEARFFNRMVSLIPGINYPPDAIQLKYEGTRVQDRKSTRLNSSHVKISYAVFCLKK